MSGILVILAIAIVVLALRACFRGLLYLRRSSFISTSSIIISSLILAFLTAKGILIILLITSAIKVKRFKDSPRRSNSLVLYSLITVIRKFIGPDGSYII